MGRNGQVAEVAVFDQDDRILVDGLVSNDEIELGGAGFGGGGGGRHEPVGAGWSGGLGGELHSIEEIGVLNGGAVGELGVLVGGPIGGGFVVGYGPTVGDGDEVEFVVGVLGEVCAYGEFERSVGDGLVVGVGGREYQVSNAVTGPVVAAGYTDDAVEKVLVGGLQVLGAATVKVGEREDEFLFEEAQGG